MAESFVIVNENPEKLAKVSSLAFKSPMCECLLQNNIFTSLPFLETAPYKINKA
jgi:hypothetical protein